MWEGWYQHHGCGRSHEGVEQSSLQGQPAAAEDTGSALLAEALPAAARAPQELLAWQGTPPRAHSVPGSTLHSPRLLPLLGGCSCICPERSPPLLGARSPRSIPARTLASTCPTQIPQDPAFLIFLGLREFICEMGLPEGSLWACICWAQSSRSVPPRVTQAPSPNDSLAHGAVPLGLGEPHRNGHDQRREPCKSMGQKVSLQGVGDHDQGRRHAKGQQALTFTLTRRCPP